MNPSETKQQAPPVVSEDVLSNIMAKTIERYEAATRPFGADDSYSEEDAKLLGLPSPRALNLLTKFVRRMHGSPMVPKWIAVSNNPEGTMLAAMLRGRELGFQLMESLEVFWMSPDGRLALWGQTMMSLMRRRGVKFDFLQQDDEMYEIKATREDGETYTASFGREDAVRAGLWDKDKSIHKKYPKTMLKWRCVGDLWRTLCSDFTGFGHIYAREELTDVIEETERREREESGSNAEFAKDAAARAKENEFHVGRTGADVKDAVAKQAEKVAEEPPVETKAPVAETKTPDPEPTSAPTETKAPEAEKKSEPAPAPEPKVETEKKSNVSEMPKTDSAAANKEKVLALTDKLPSVSPVKAQKMFGEFFKGFLGVSSLPKGDEKYREAFVLLEGVLDADPAAFKEDPHGTGIKSRAGLRTLQGFFERQDWSAPARELALKAMLFMGHAPNPEYFIEWASEMGLEKITESNLLPFLEVAAQTRKAYILMEASARMERPIASLVESLGPEPAKVLEAKGEAAFEAAAPAEKVLHGNTVESVSGAGLDLAGLGTVKQPEPEEEEVDESDLGFLFNVKE